MSDLTANIDSKGYYRIMEDPIVPAIVEFPTVIKQALEEFGPASANELAVSLRLIAASSTASQMM